MSKRNDYGFPQQRRRSSLFIKNYFLINVLLFVAGVFVRNSVGNALLLASILMFIIFACACAIAICGDE